MSPDPVGGETMILHAKSRVYKYTFSIRNGMEANHLDKECLLDSLLYIPINSYGHIRMLLHYGTLGCHDMEIVL